LGVSKKEVRLFINLFKFFRYIKLNNSKELPERIFKFNSTYSISIYK